MNPDSNMPSRKRVMYSPTASCTNKPMATRTKPHVNMMRANHTFAPTRYKIRLLGISNRT